MQSLARSAVLIGFICLFTPQLGFAQSCVTTDPSSGKVTFNRTAVGTVSAIKRIGLTNKCGKNIQISNFSISAPEFILEYGWAPINKGPSGTAYYALRLKPDAAKTFTGTFTASGTGFSPVTVSLNGTGLSTSAIASFSASALSFGNQGVGSSITQPVTLTNTGTSPFTVNQVYADPPFAVSGFSGKPTPLNPGSSLPLQVTFTPWQEGTTGGTLVMVSDVLPSKGVTLSGTGVSPSSLAVNTYPTLQWATQGYAYNMQLNGAGGTAPLSWSLPNGSNLPFGLTLSPQGLISGTVNSSVGVGDYSFFVSVTDSSSPPQTASTALTIPVGAPNGDVCNKIQWDVAGTSTPMVNLFDLGTGTYLGAEGGLYLDGSNVMPASHDSDGVKFAQAIQPMDGNGKPDPNGKYVLLVIGESCGRDTFLQFVQDAQADPSLNSHLVIVGAAMPGAAASSWAGATFGGWNSILNFLLPQNGVTAKQVVAVWVSTTDDQIHGVFPADMVQLQSEYESIAQNLHSLFPKLTLAFYTSRFYAGFGNPGISSPEPYAYESGFAVRGMIEDQLNGLPSMNYNGTIGPIKAPWVAWGSYDWANGMNARSDGFAWSCQDFAPNDGEHNSQPQGSEKDANLLLNFFRSNDATTPWFLAPGN